MEGAHPGRGRPAAGRADDATVAGALVEAARRLSSELSVDGVSAVALESLAAIFGATASWLMVCEGEHDLLRTILFRGSASAVYGGVTVPEHQPVLTRVALEQGCPTFIADVRKEARWFDPARVQASGLESVVLLPLIDRGRRIGLIGFDSPRYRAGAPPDARDLRWLGALSAQIAVALANAGRFEAAQRRNPPRMPGAERVPDHDGPERAARREILGHRLVVGSAKFAGVMQQAELVARADTTVLLCGETGTGKEIVARLIHETSRRRRGPFVAINCAALPEPLVESELFGHERGAFTGAAARKPGSFELAHHGTLFLDEIGDLPVEAQAKLLRVLQDREVRRVGATAPTPVDVRVIAASNRDLTAAIADGTFRADLYYRLSVFPILLPPLRERPDDIPVLARHFLEQFAARQGKRQLAFTPAALDHLAAYAWPGNVRELQNVVERAVILSRGEEIDVASLALAPGQAGSAPPALPVRRGASEPVDDPAAAEPPRVKTLAQADREAILAALDAAEWRISGPGGAAEQLGLKPTTLHAKMRKLGIRRPKPSDLSRVLQKRLPPR